MSSFLSSFISGLIISIIIVFASAYADLFDGRQDLGNYTSCDKPLILTPYIESGKILKAQKLARVRSLEGAGNITSYSGYLTIDKKCNSNLFFWYFPSLDGNNNAPVTLWLQGGPGSSSLYGLFDEIGPFFFKNQTKSLESRNYSWNSLSSLLFIDNPVGTGYSFTNNDTSCYATNEDEVGSGLYNALIQFFKLFPKLQANDFFIFGESYAGKYIPAIGYYIHKNNPQSELKINLKGLGIGDGFSDPENQANYDEFLYQLGLIDELEKSKLKEMENEFIKAIKEGNYSLADSKYPEISSLNIGVNIYDYGNDTRSPDLGDYEIFVTKPSSRCAIHVGNVCYSCQSYTVGDTLLSSDFVMSVRPWIEILIENYPILFYNGQFDIIVGFPLTRNFVNKLSWSGAEEFKKKHQYPFFDSTQKNVCGYVKSFKNLNLAMIRSASHMVPGDQPECAFIMYKSFLFNRHNFGNVS